MKALMLFVAIGLISAGLGIGEEPPRTSPPAVPSAEDAKPASKVDPAAWLNGKWTFDGEYTTQKYQEANKGKESADLGEALVVPQLLEKLKGSTLRISEKEVVMTTRDGNGKAFPHEVLEAEEGKSVTMKQSDGQVTTYHKEGADRFWTSSTGTVNVPFFFKRAQ